MPLKRQHDSGNAWWNDHIRFRDYLLSHPEARAEYLTLKRDLAGRYAHDRPAYTEAKGEFVRRILALAERERSQ